MQSTPIPPVSSIQISTRELSTFLRSITFAARQKEKKLKSMLFVSLQMFSNHVNLLSCGCRLSNNSTSSSVEAVAITYDNEITKLKVFKVFMACINPSIPFYATIHPLIPSHSSHPSTLHPSTHPIFFILSMHLPHASIHLSHLIHPICLPHASIQSSLSFIPFIPSHLSHSSTHSISFISSIYLMHPFNCPNHHMVLPFNHLPALFTKSHPSMHLILHVSHPSWSDIPPICLPTILFYWSSHPLLSSHPSIHLFHFTPCHSLQYFKLSFLHTLEPQDCASWIIIRPED